MSATEHPTPTSTADDPAPEPNPVGRMRIRIFHVGKDGTTLIRTASSNMHAVPTWGVRR